SRTVPTPMEHRTLLSLLLCLGALPPTGFAGLAADAKQTAPLASAPATHNSGLFLGVSQFEDETILPLSFAVDDAVSQAYLFVIELRLIPPTNCTLLISGEPT